MTLPTFFEFERDFAGSLRCIPMEVRQKLDLCGLKLTLDQWEALPHDQRVQLLRTPCSDRQEGPDYAALVKKLVQESCGESVKPLPPEDFSAWEKSGPVPEVVKAQAARDRVSPPTEKQWNALKPLQKFCLLKLAKSEHENINFVPALKEFGLVS